MELVAEAARGWVEQLVVLRTNREWKEFMLDWDNDISWNEMGYELGPEVDI